MIQAVCVFCGSSVGRHPEYREAAGELGGELARRGITLIYGGTNVGLMAIAADACLSAGGSVVGVVPQILVTREIAHRGLTTLHVVESMHARKALMAELADAFVALPGGFGTFEELFEMLTWTQLGLQQKACGVVNVLGYYDCVLRMADHAVNDGFLLSAHREMLLAASTPAAVLDLIAGYEPPSIGKWVDLAKA